MGDSVLNLLLYTFVQGWTGLCGETRQALSCNEEGSTTVLTMSKAVSTQNNTYLVCGGANDFAVVLGDGTKSRCTHCFASKSCRHVTAVAKNATTEASDDGSDSSEGLDEGAEQFSTLDNLADEYLDAEGNLRIRSVSQVCGAVY